MPTYKNLTNSPIVTFEANTSRCINVGEEVASAFLLESFGLTKTSDLPYFNPILDSQTVTSDTEIEIVASKTMINIDVYNNASVSVFINSLSNTPPLILTNRSISINNFNQISKIHIKFNSPGKVDINQVLISSGTNLYFK
jgi:hypothetical protein